MQLSLPGSFSAQLSSTQESFISALLRSSQSLLSCCSVPYRRQHHPLALDRMSRLLVQHGELSALCARAGFSFVLERQISMKSTNLGVNHCYTLGYLLQAMSFLITPCAKAWNPTKPAHCTLHTPRVWSKRTMPLLSLHWSFAINCLEIGFQRIRKALSNTPATAIFMLRKYSAKGSEKPKLCSLRNKVMLELTDCKERSPPQNPLLHCRSIRSYLSRQPRAQECMIQTTPIQAMLAEQLFSGYYDLETGGSGKGAPWKKKKKKSSLKPANGNFLAQKQVAAFGYVPLASPLKVYPSLTALSTASSSHFPLSTAAFSWWNRSHDFNSHHDGWEKRGRAVATVGPVSQ